MIDAREGNARRATTAVLFAFAFQTVYFSGLFPPFRNPNELSRFEAVVAMAEWKTLSIDQATILGDHEDKSVSDGRFYSNKAPGLAFAAYPVYRLLRLAFPAPTASTIGPLLWAVRLLTVSLVSLIALVRLAARLREEPGRHVVVAPLVLLAVTLGTPFLYYGRSFFAHAWTAALVFLAWDCLRASETPTARAAVAAGAGFLVSWAVISEYTVAPIALVLALRVLAGRAPKSIAAFAAGAAVPLGLLLAYNALCFGSPWTLSSAREADPAYAALATQGVFGIGRPNLARGRDYLVSPARGVLLFSPFLAAFVVGAVRWWRSGRDRADCAFVLASTGLFFVALTGYPNWNGGWSLGSRYLLPAILLAALPLGWALETRLSRSLFLMAAVFSVAAHAVMTSTFTHLPPEQAWPAETSGWFLARGWIAQNLGSVVGLSGWASLLLPALVTVAALTLVVRCAQPIRPSAFVALCVGAAPLAVLLLSPPALSYDVRLWRAAALGAFSDRDPERVELRSTATEATTDQDRRRVVNIWGRYYGPLLPPAPAP